MVQKTKIEGITQLRNDLLDYYLQARNGKVPIKEVGHLSQLAGKIINSVKTQLQYHIHLERKEKIDFLEK